MFYTLDIKFKRNTFDFLKLLYDLNYLCDKIKQIRKILTKREFIYKLKIYGNNKKYEIMKKVYVYWVTFINKKNIVESLKLYKLKKKNQQYQDLVNKNKIILALKRKQKEVNLINKRKIILIKIINIKIKKIENIILKYFSHWKKIVFTNNISNINNNINDINMNMNNNADKITNADDGKNKSNNITNVKTINITNETINNISEEKSKSIPKKKAINIHIQVSGKKKYNNINNINKINTIKKDNPKERSVSTKKRVVKRSNYRTKYNHKSETKSRKIINKKETLLNAIYTWKSNAKKLSIIEDYKYILNRIKKQNKENYKLMGDRADNEQKLLNINIDLLNKLKKVSLHLLLSIYQKSLTNLIYKYFNIWKSNINMKILNNNIINNNNNQKKNKNKKLIKQISKYVRKKVGSCYKQKENKLIPNQKFLFNSNSYKKKDNIYNDIKNINNVYASKNYYDIIDTNDNNIIKNSYTNNSVKKRPEKTFSKKKTKLNLHKDKINRYKDENKIKKNKEIKEKNVPNNIINNNNNILFNDYNYIIDNYNCNTNTYSNSNIEISNEYSSQNKYIVIETNSDNNSKNNNNILSPDNYISNELTTNTESKYVIRKPKKRTCSQPKIKKINLNDKELIDNKTPTKHISKSGEKNTPAYRNNNDLLNLNSYLENLITKTDYSFQYPNRSRNDKKDKKIESNLNKRKDTQSSHEQSSCNHITLIEESNEVKKPMDYVNTPNCERQIKKNLNQYFSPPNELSNSSLPRNYLLTDSRIKKNIYQQPQYENYMPSYDEDLLCPRTYISRENINQIPVYSFSKLTFTQYGKNIEKLQDSNIYLEPNEEEEINGIPNLKTSHNIKKNNIMNNNYGNNNTQYYNNSFLRDHNKNNLKKTNNSLYERMQERKKNLNNYSPYSRNVNRDNNKVRITYNQFDFSGNEDYNNTYNNENETMYNNYNNLKPIFY